MMSQAGARKTMYAQIYSLQLAIEKAIVLAVANGDVYEDGPLQMGANGSL